MGGESKAVIGLMSGTSMDAIDVAWLQTDGDAVITPGPVGEYVYLPGERAAIAGVLGAETPDAAAITAVTDAHIRAVAAFLQTHPDLQDTLEMIGFHGQTICHDPARRLTVQIGDAARLAGHFGVPVVHDFRSADIAAGGEGAPLAPLFHRALAAGIEAPVCVLNLGGVGNLTWIGAEDKILAFDTGPANALLDDLMLAHTGTALDRDGETARSGHPDMARVREWLRFDYFSRKPPKSLDRNHFQVDVADLDLADAAATLTALTVESVAAAAACLPRSPHSWIVAGGGRRNSFLMACLRERLSAPVEPAEAVGWSGDALEAQCFAWLAVRSLRGQPLSLPETTGVPRPMPGGRIAYPPAAAFSSAISARRRST